MTPSGPRTRTNLGIRASVVARTAHEAFVVEISGVLLPLTSVHYACIIHHADFITKERGESPHGSMPSGGALNGIVRLRVGNK